MWGFWGDCAGFLLLALALSTYTGSCGGGGITITVDGAKHTISYGPNK